MEIITKRIKDIKPYEKNPRKNDAAVEYHIYGIINKDNSKIYIGQTKRGYRRRFVEHKCPGDQSLYLRNAIQKHGRDAFECELLDIAYSQDEANYKERMWIMALGTYKRDKGYNISMGGGIQNMSEETKHKMSESRRGEGNSFYGKHHTEDAKQRMSKSKKGMYALDKHPCAKRVYCVETTTEYSCAKEAELLTGINAHHIGQVANGNYGRKTAGGCHWIWI